MREQDSLIYSSSSSLSYPSDLLPRPPFSTQVAQSYFYLRPNLTFPLTSPPALQALSDLLSLFRHFNRRSFKRRVTNFLTRR